jgi:hypothetical protein
MSWFSVDIEADGPIPGDFSMVSLGLVRVDRALACDFYAELRPISARWQPEALAVCGFSREQTLSFADPAAVMADCAAWLARVSVGPPRLISDNNGFDWQFVNWYFHHFLGHNPFGHSSVNLNSLYKGLQADMSSHIHSLRRSPHTHHALTDARGNAEVLLQLQRQGLKIRLD